MIKVYNFLRDRKTIIVDIILLSLIIAFLFTVFEPEYLLLKTTPTGGDTPAHNYLAKYLRDELLPQGKLFGWAPGWWAGFPMFQYYFPFPYLLMALLGYVIPLEVAFKIISVLGIFTLPIATYWAMRLMDMKSPGPSVGAVMSLAFLFVSTHKMWGGNVYSTLAGEIAHSLSFPIGILFFGYLYRCIYLREGRFSLWLPLLFTLIIFTHLTTAMVIGFGSLFFLLTLKKERFLRNLRLLTCVYGLSFLFAAFWGIPLLAKIGFSVGFGEDWGIRFFKTFPKEAWIYLIFSITALVYGGFKRDRRVFYVLAMIASSLLFYKFAYYLNLVNIRFWPSLYLFFLILTSMGIGLAVERVKGAFLLPFILMALLLVKIMPLSVEVRNWSEWNYSGFEGKAAWRDYKEIVSVLDNTPGRVANDLADYNNAFGSPRVFENIPYFVNKPVIEGGIIQSGISSIFTMYIQCEISHHCAGFPRIVTPTTYDLDHGMKHLELFNVKHIIAYYDRLKADLAQRREWRLVKKVNSHEVYELLTHDGSYVFVPRYEPIPVETEDWKILALDWFYNVENLDFPLIFTDKVDSQDAGRFRNYVDEATIRRELLSKVADRSYIYNWLLLGTFKNPRDHKMDFWDPKSDNPFTSRINEGEIEPAMGRRTGWKTWSTYYGSREYIDLARHFSRNDEVVAYAFSYVYSPARQKVSLWYGSDDGIKIWLNGAPVEERHLHRPYIKDQDRVEAILEKGINRLLVMVENAGGGWGFSMKITNIQGVPIDGLGYQLAGDGSRAAEHVDIKEIHEDCSIEEAVSAQEIQFDTSCTGKPHIIKVSYYPNWKVTGADKVYMVSPSFMLVYPSRNHVRLYYSNSTSDWIGLVLSGTGLAIVVAYSYHRIRKRYMRL